MTRLLGAFRRERNGLVADTMHYDGARYGLNYGVSLPTVRQIAREQTADHELALYLYKQQVRELRLAALHIAEPERITVQELPTWAEGVINSEVAEEMAIGACKSANADCAIATTGIAGPTGGTEENPVGTVCFACVVKDQVLTERMIFEGTRMEIRMQAAVYAIEMLCDYIETCYEDGEEVEE